ncbi:transcriptional regulator, MerR family [Clostridium sp. USBA 49]|uniref:MerR family transcriptional regulator n=1 Tax=Clostridium TaxID=1485 RepID=UPI0009990B60|nr:MULTISPECIES: MerR family transcriptional regulator [Clostridium]SKA74877.1 transcriptional regulator, MerR family [Clostridium sp. USBA 49]
MDNKYYQIEEVAAKTGLTKRAIRYYEDIELIKPIRTKSFYRLYTDEDIENILRIKDLKGKLGFSLNEVKDIFELELDIKSIFKGEKYDHDFIEDSIKKIEGQLKIIEEKEETLKKVKNKYIEILEKLLTINYNK